VHEINIPGWAVDRVIKRRGTEHVFEDFDPARTALIVIDMQNAFMLPGVAFVVIKTAPEIVPNINRLATAGRSAGGTVVWIRMTYTDQASVDWSACYRLSTPEINQRRSDALAKGAKGHQIWDTLEVHPDDPMIEKTRFSALIQGSSDLNQFLRERDIDTLIITGCLTDVCCESTARDAMMLNYNAIMVTDANAADTDDDHNNALTAFYTTFGDIMPTDMIVSLLGQ
jgi:ureidoacrylate peracid hydrolase